MDFRTSLAALVIGTIPEDKLPAIAADAIEEGLASPSLAALALVNPPNIFQIRKLFASALEECGIQLPAEDDARERVLRFWLSEIVEGRMNPIEGLRHIVREVDTPGVPTPGKLTYVGAELRIEKLVGLYWQHEDLLEEGRLRPDWREKILGAIHEEARKRLESSPP